MKTVTLDEILEMLPEEEQHCWRNSDAWTNRIKGANGMLTQIRQILESLRK